MESFFFHLFGISSPPAKFQSGEALALFVEKKKRGGEGKRYHPRGVMTDDALRQGRSEYARSKTKVRGASEAFRGDDKETAITDV